MPTAVITGASAGFGAATARHLHRLGFELVLGARRLDRLEAVTRDLPGARAHPLDVTEPESCAAFCAAAGTPDVLVNSAGGAAGLDKLQDAREEDHAYMFEANVLGLLRVTRLFLPAMIARGTGTIVNLGSVAALEPYAGGTAYCGSKAAVKAITKALRHDLLGTGVRVCNVEPAAAETEFSLARFKGDEARAQKVYQGFTPLSADDVAEIVTFVVTRPPHVNLEEIVVYPTAQASSTAFHRK